jgi:hypothetical protein
MTVDGDWQWGVSNVGQCKLLIWLEPWAEEFEVPHRSTLTLRIINSSIDSEFPEIQATEDNVVIWAGSGDLIEVSIDQILQDSYSARAPVPEVSGLSSKEFLNIVFSKQPEARLGGRKLPQQAQISVWGRIKRSLGL